MCNYQHQTCWTRFVLCACSIINEHIYPMSVSTLLTCCLTVSSSVFNSLFYSEFDCLAFSTFLRVRNILLRLNPLVEASAYLWLRLDVRFKHLTQEMLHQMASKFGFKLTSTAPPRLLPHMPNLLKVETLPEGDNGPIDLIESAVPSAPFAL
jgi:hypothetical protein